MSAFAKHGSVEKIFRKARTNSEKMEAFSASCPIECAAENGATLDSYRFTDPACREKKQARFRNFLKLARRRRNDDVSSVGRGAQHTALARPSIFI